MAIITNGKVIKRVSENTYILLSQRTNNIWQKIQDENTPLNNEVTEFLNRKENFPNDINNTQEIKAENIPQSPISLTSDSPIPSFINNSNEILNKLSVKKIIERVNEFSIEDLKADKRKGVQKLIELKKI